MDINFVDTYFVPGIVALCLCIGYVLRNFIPTDNKWIPLILLIVGVISGVIVGGTTFDSVVGGAVSGLASVGLNQAFKQALGLNVRADIEATEDEVIESELDAEEEEADAEDDSAEGTETAEETEA